MNYIDYPTEDDVFPFSLSNNNSTNITRIVPPPLLSHTPDSADLQEEDENCKDEFLISSPLMYPVQSNNLKDDELFDLDDEDLIYVPSNEDYKSAPTIIEPTSESSDFANAAQENYRLWLMSVWQLSSCRTTIHRNQEKEKYKTKIQTKHGMDKSVTHISLHLGTTRLSNTY